MDFVDIDPVLDVPDTPDRSAVQSINGRDCIKKESHSSMNENYSGNKDFFDDRTRNWPRNKNKVVTDIGSRKLLFRSSKNLSISDKSEAVSALGNSSSTKNALPFMRMVEDKTANHENKHSIHSQPTDKGKAFSTSQFHSSACKEDLAVVDLTQKNGHAQVLEKSTTCGALGNSLAEEFRKESLSDSSFSSFHNTENYSSLLNNACKVKEKEDETCKVGSSFDRGNEIGFVGDSQPKAGKTLSATLRPINSCRVTGRKRLVRNGCISPHNIAKAKQSAEKHDNSSVGGHNDTGTVVFDAPPSLIGVRDLIAEANDSHRAKGKEVINYPFSSKGLGAETMHLSSRSSTTLNEKADGTSDASGDAFRSFEGLGGWRSTRNRTRKTTPPFSDEDQHLSSGKYDPSFVNQQYKERAVRRDYRNGISSRNLNDYTKDHDSVSCQLVSAQPVAQTESHLRHQSGQFNEHQHAANTLIKRQKQGSTSSNHGKGSIPAFDDSELVFLGSSGEPSDLRSSRNQNRHGTGILDPVIELDEFSPEIRNSGSHNTGCSSNNDSDVKARQLEADEMLARELQEELYNEVPIVGVGEIDTHIAFALQHEENSQHAFPTGRRRVFHPRDSLSNLYTQSQPSSSQNPLLRRGTQVRMASSIPTSTRMARLRGRFPGQSRTVSSRERNSVFPPNMDVDMRIHILEALEAFNDMGMTGDFLQVQRDFNENDYEMLLALDENNHHVGASTAQINGLPQSTVQNDNEEACAICLETPSTGDTIRHLPCLHKFHKDCIDPWLRRRTSCPVCKSSIT